MDAADRFRDLTQRAQRSNVSFVTVDPYGLGAVDPFSSQPLGKGSLDLLRTLAETTGGLSSVAASDLSASMRDLAAGVASYYLMGYYSTNTQFNGRYRSIDVKVAQPRVQVSARRGYTAPRK
jgi:VWFA-related protein